MTGQLWYPPADNKSQRFDSKYPGTVWSGPLEKGCLHTTETTSWPGYDGGSNAPNFTVKPVFSEKKMYWRQHFPANMSSRALKNLSGGVETNKDKCIQVEICGTCDDMPEGKHDDWVRDGVTHLFTPEAPDWVLEQLADFFRWCNEEHGISLSHAGTWLNYGPDSRAPGRLPASYGESPVRMSGSTYNNFRGWLGHQHVAENSHGDPGKFNVAKIIEIAKGEPVAPAAEEEDENMKIVNSSDGRQWLIGFGGKIYISTPQQLDELKRIGVPQKGECSSNTLALFPTLDTVDIANLVAFGAENQSKGLEKMDQILAKLDAMGSTTDTALLLEIKAMVQQLLDA